MELITEEPISLHVDSTSSLAKTVFSLIERNKALQKEVEILRARLETSRKLQIQPKLYPPESDPYYGEEDGA